MEYPPTEEILEDLRNLETEIAKNLEELEEMLKWDNKV